MAMLKRCCTGPRRRERHGWTPTASERPRSLSPRQAPTRQHLNLRRDPRPGVVTRDEMRLRGSAWSGTIQRCYPDAGRDQARRGYDKTVGPRPRPGQVTEASNGGAAHVRRWRPTRTAGVPSVPAIAEEPNNNRLNQVAITWCAEGLPGPSSWWRRWPTNSVTGVRFGRLTGPGSLAAPIGLGGNRDDAPVAGRDLQPARAPPASPSEERRSRLGARAPPGPDARRPGSGRDGTRPGRGRDAVERGGTSHGTKPPASTVRCAAGDVGRAPAGS